MGKQDKAIRVGLQTQSHRRDHVRRINQVKGNIRMQLSLTLTENSTYADVKGYILNYYRLYNNQNVVESTHQPMQIYQVKKGKGQTKSKYLQLLKGYQKG